MPILYSNKNNIFKMKELKEMTQLEASDWIRIKNKPVLDGYTVQEANRLSELVKLFIDPTQRSCAHCGTTGGLREAKDKFVKYFLENKDNIEKISDGINPFVCPKCLNEVCICEKEVIIKSTTKKNKK